MSLIRLSITGIDITMETQVQSKNIMIKSDMREKVRERLTHVYEDMLKTIGLTGREIARLSGTRPQYISDIKRRQRPLSNDMFLRTLTGLYGEYKWLITGDLVRDTKHIIDFYPYISRGDGELFPLPVLERPFVGPTMTPDEWDGTFFCVTSLAADRARKMTNPYILHLPFSEKGGRFRQGDYLLVEQADNPESKFVLVKNGWGVKLTRRAPEGFLDTEHEDKYYPLDTPIVGSVGMLVFGEP